MSQSFNNHQLSAIKSLSNKLVIIAGAGTGKTSIIINRVADLIINKSCNPGSIMIITFSNNTVREIKERIKKNFYMIYQLKLCIGTFHSISYMLFKKYYLINNIYKKIFFLSPSHQLKLIKKICQTYPNPDYKKINTNKLLDFININKENGLRANQINFNITSDTTEKLYFLKIYQKYEQICFKYKYIDYAEIILTVNDLFKINKKFSLFCQKQFNHILVDEFQDTNEIQYNFLLNLIHKKNNVCVVGDDDQSIYGWRGSKKNIFSNIVNKLNNCKIIKLEQNYRSTNNILILSNTIVQFNKNRFCKQLWTLNKKNNLIHFYEAKDEIEEIISIANYIKNMQNNDISIAILYRNNFQSLIVSIILAQNNLSYQLESNYNYNKYFILKIVFLYFNFLLNKTKKHFCEKLLKHIFSTKDFNNLIKNLNLLYSNNNNYWKSILNYTNLANNIEIKKKLIYFIELIKKIEYILYNNKNFFSIIEMIINIIINNKLHYLEYTIYYNKHKNFYLDEIQFLCSLAKTFETNNLLWKNSLKNFLPLSIFYPNTTNKKKNIYIMTIHASKGLEFDKVFIIGLQEGLLPNLSKFTTYKINDDYLEEERRLLYVAITRSKIYLRLSWAINNIIYKNFIVWECSRFIKELLHANKKIIYFEKKFPNKKKNFFFNKYYGIQVIHDKFGKGFIISKNVKNEHVFYKIKFNIGITKKIITTYKNLKFLK